MPNNKSVLLKIKRQLTPDAKPSWEEFEIPYKPNMNVTSALMEIAANPVTRDKFTAIALQPLTGSTPDSFAAYIKSEVDRWAVIVKNSGAELE